MAWYRKKFMDQFIDPIHKTKGREWFKAIVIANLSPKKWFRLVVPSLPSIAENIINKNSSNSKLFTTSSMKCCCSRMIFIVFFFEILTSLFFSFYFFRFPGFLIIFENIWHALINRHNKQKPLFNHVWYFSTHFVAKFTGCRISHLFCCHIPVKMCVVL